MEKRLLLFTASIFFSFFILQMLFPPQGQSIPEPKKTELISSLNLEVAAKSDPTPREEQFYVLENEFQQLVFSTLGGALAEINLPLHSDQHPKSIVKPLDLDRFLLEQTPLNSHFPLLPANRWNAKEGTHGVQEGTVGGYYPLLRRTLLNQDGSIRSSLNPRYYALNLTSNGEDLSSLPYRVTRFEPDSIQFEATSGSQRIRKTFTLLKDRPYCFECTIQMEGNGPAWLTSGVPEVELVSGSFTPQLRSQITHNKSIDIDTIDLSDKHPIFSNTSAAFDWVSNSNGFLGILMDPVNAPSQGFQAEKIAGEQVPTRLSLIDEPYHPYPADKYAGYLTALSIHHQNPMTFRIFAGPYDRSLFKELDAAYTDPATGTNPNYEGAPSIQGWFSFISRPFAQFLSFLLQIFYSLTRSWGFSIILLTIALRLMMTPLNNWHIRSSLKMQEFAPKIKAIQERFKKDPKKGQLEVMNFYREKGINPFSGCIPILLQMPFLIGMFYLLKSTFPLRGASFIPGWIDNLAAPDILFTWSVPIWFIGNEFHLLPILLGLTMYWQQKMTTKPSQGTEISDLQKQQKIMGTLMPIILTVMFYGFPSGLNIYFISTNLLAILQQWLLTKKIQRAPVISP